MTESEWQSCADPQRMLTVIRGKASGRRLRLLACACCRRVWGLLSGDESRHAVLVAERFADGLVNADELTAAGRHAARPAKGAAARRMSNSPGAAGKAAAGLVGSHAYGRVYAAYGERPQRGAPQRAAKELGLSAQAAQDPRDAYLEAEARERAEQAALLRDIFCNPFRPPSRIDPSWLARNDGTVKKLAEAIYEGRSFDRLLILADALEEAGCDDTELLGHLRGPGPHVKGCWALDLVLGKQ